uniref:TOG domain-containing protein n=1 Tax=Gouania willdenowi TaxID=441366 RepID=A0A8C5N703_GOUWI
MDCELEVTVKLLLKKAGDSNSFIRQDADKALDSMVQHCTPSRCLHTSLSSLHLGSLVRRIVSGAKDITDHLIPAIGKLAQDASPEARYVKEKTFSFIYFFITTPLIDSQTQSVADKNHYIEQLSGLMGSKDFKDRIQGINQIVADSQNDPNVFDAISARLTESNSKVNLHTLMVLPEIICALEENMAQVVNTLVPAIVDSHLNSKNKPIYCAISFSTIDNTHLLQLFCNKAMFLNGKAKADLIDKVAAIVTNIGNRKPQMVKQRALPLLWHLLGISTHSSSTHNLCNALYNEMGSELAECAMSQPLNIRQTLNKILSSLP